MAYTNEPHDDYYDQDDVEDFDEPTGSCDMCGCNVYDFDDLCDQCDWMVSQCGYTDDEVTPID